SLQEALGRISSADQLVYAGDMSDPQNGRFFQAMQERVTSISSLLLFFTLEITRIEEPALEEKLESPALQRWAPWLRDQRAWPPYQLAEAVQRVPHEKPRTGRD